MSSKKMKILHILGAISLFGIIPLYADTVGGEISIGAFNHTPSGYASYTLPYIGLGTSADLQNTFQWRSETDLLLKAYIEHPLPFLPNVKVAYTTLSQSGNNTVNDFTWGNIVIPSNGSIENSFEWTKYDMTFYYELLDNWLELDAGITLGYIDGNIAVTAVSGFGPLMAPPITESTDFSLFIPTLYGKSRFNIPSTDISLQAEGDFFSYNDTTYYDFELSARYTFTMGLGLECGYKALHFDSSDLVDGLVIESDFDGLYAAMVWNF